MAGEMGHPEHVPGEQMLCFYIGIGRQELFRESGGEEMSNRSAPFLSGEDSLASNKAGAFLL